MNAKHRRSPRRDRYRDRSSSRERPRTRTYNDHHSESYASDYSDDFEPDSKSRDRTPPPRRKQSDRQRRRGPYYSDQSSMTHLHSSATSKKSTRSVGRGLNRGAYKKPRPKHGWRSQNSSKNPTSRDTITARLLSAKERKINEIQNELLETEQRLEAYQKENKLLKTVQHRQDKALRRFQDVESDLPRLISQNFEDQRVLKTRLKKAQDAEKIVEEKLRENNDEMQKMEKTLRKLKKVVYDKNLGERSELARQLTNTENDLTVAERKVKELEKKLELTTSSFTRQIKGERQKHKETKEKLDALIEDFQSMKAKLREKERALDVSNIYALRKKEGSSLPSNKSTPRNPDTSSSSTQTEGLLPVKYHDTNKSDSHAMVEFKEKISVKDSKTASDNIYGDRRLESPTGSSPAPFSKSHKSSLKKNPVALNGLHSTTLNQNRMNDQKREGEKSIFVTSKLQSDSSSPHNSFVQDSIDFEKSETALIREENEESSLRSNSQKSDKKDPLKEVEKEKKLEEERAKLAEQQKKKAELLAKMRQIEQEDSGLSPLEGIKSPTDGTNPLLLETEKNPPSTNKIQQNPKSKAELVKSLFGTDPDPVVENLHMGLPANGKKAPEKAPEKELSFGGYAPSVGTTQASRKPRAPNKTPKPLASDSENDEPLFDLNSGKQSKKSDLLTQLFGEQAKANDESEKASKTAGSVTPRAKPVHSGYPWEKNVVTSNHSNGTTNHVSNKVKTGMTIKASAPIQDDDIEELAL